MISLKLGLGLSLLSLTFFACSSSDSDDKNTGGSGGMSQSTGGTGGSSGAGQGGSGDTGGAPEGGGGGIDLTSDPGSGMCEDFEPCGGDITGEWTLESLCAPDLPVEGCPGGKTVLSASGALNFADDMTYTTTVGIVVTTTLPPECAAMCQAGCTMTDDGGCECALPLPHPEGALDYSTDGKKLVVHPQPGVMETTYYCVDGDEVYLRGYSAMGLPYQQHLTR